MLFYNIAFNFYQMVL